MTNFDEILNGCKDNVQRVVEMYVDIYKMNPGDAVRLNFNRDLGAIIKRFLSIASKARLDTGHMANEMGALSKKAKKEFDHGIGLN